MDAPASKSYEGPSGIGRDSVWLTYEDLVEGRDAPVKIVDVLLYPSVKFQGGRTRINALGLRFEGKQRVLLLNATNRKVLNKAFSNIAKSWKGQTVVLYVAETSMAGETVKCVRIRDQKARGVAAAEDFLLGSDEHDPKSNGLVHANAAVVEAANIIGLSQTELSEIAENCAGDDAAILSELNRMADERNG